MGLILAQVDCFAWLQHHVVEKENGKETNVFGEISGQLEKQLALSFQFSTSLRLTSPASLQ
ncbi:hypothetical protein TYRP_018854 [Tyrophagus putrescentiae]|nr:hypothetical protein TYRP_018854 [Tyrophagus putrescentiae]